MNRPSIRDLLPSHRCLLDHHRRRLIELMGIAIEQGIDPSSMAFVIADTRGDFGIECVSAGFEFLSLDPDGAASMVIGLGTDGLVVIVAELVPDAVEPMLTRPAGTTPILVVDQDDEPALVFVAISELTERRPC